MASSPGVHYKKSKRLAEINHAHLQSMASLLEEGQRQKTFKKDIDPLQININIAALGAYYLINQYGWFITLAWFHLRLWKPDAE
ncbi:hypothetical protein OkiPb01091_46100 [Escherichia coli]